MGFLKEIGNFAQKHAEISRERSDFYQKCQTISDEELEKIFCNDGFFGKPSWQREMAKNVYLKRNQ